MIYQFNNTGLANLLVEVIRSAREEFERAYYRFNDALKESRSDYDTRQAIAHYQNAKRFFYTPLFMAASPLNGDEYIEYMIKEIKRNGTLGASEQCGI